MESTSRLCRFGVGNTPVLILDGIHGRIADIVDIAAIMTPFPPARGSSYPGLRRPITNDDAAAAAYARETLRAAVGRINVAFGLRGFDLLDASFSLVTTLPDALAPQQRAPHFDSTDPDYLAVMHYISGVEGAGTAFYRQRATGIERLDETNLAQYLAAAQVESASWRGYIGGSNASFEQIGDVEAMPDRLVVYPGSLLHSGHIPAGMAFSPDPRRGRLTANFFVRGRR